MVKNGAKKIKRTKTTCLDCGKELSDFRKKRCRSCYHISRKGISTWNKGLTKSSNNSLKKISINMKMNNPMFKKDNVEKMRKKQLGNKYRWKGGRFNVKQGILIYKPKHPKSNSGGYIYEHRIVAEKIIGRILKNVEIVHHLDGNNKNNSKENLMITNRSNHARIHGIERIRDELGRYL